MAADLRIRHSSISNYRSGFSQAAPHVIERMARDIGENPAAWVALVESERARDAEDRRTWARIAKQLGLAAALVIAALPYESHAGTGDISRNTADAVYYVSRGAKNSDSRRGRFARLLDRLVSSLLTRLNGCDHAPRPAAVLA